MKRALITGITGQDGSYLTELLLEKGYEVFGMVRRASTDTLTRIIYLLERISLCSGNLLDPSSLISILREVQPDEIYNLAAQSFVYASWAQSVATAQFIPPSGSPGCSMRSGWSARTLASTRRVPARCSARPWKSSRPSAPPFIRGVPTVGQSVWALGDSQLPGKP